MMSDYSKKFIVKPGSKVRLKHFDAGYHGKRESHERALPEIQQHIEKMAQLHYLMYAERKDSLLVVLQGLHAAGEDGVVRHIFTTGGATIPTKRMKILLASVVLYLACTAGPAAFAAEKVGFITVDGAIGPATASYISRSIEEAKAQNVQCLLIQLNTPGGLLDSTQKIVQSFLGSRVPRSRVASARACPICWNRSEQWRQCAGSIKNCGFVFRVLSLLQLLSPLLQLRRFRRGENAASQQTKNGARERY